MSVHLSTKVWDLECDSHTQKLVLLALADNASAQGKCWPSIPYLACKCQVSERGIYKIIGQLKEKGWIKVRHGGRVGRSNTYNITLPLTPERGSGRGEPYSGRGEPYSGKPSYNRHGTEKGVGTRKAPKFVSEVRAQLGVVIAMINSNRNKHCSEGNWDCEGAAEHNRLIKRRKELEAELVAL